MSRIGNGLSGALITPGSVILSEGMIQTIYCGVITVWAAKDWNKTRTEDSAEAFDTFLMYRGIL